MSDLRFVTGPNCGLHGDNGIGNGAGSAQMPAFLSSAPVPTPHSPQADAGRATPPTEIMARRRAREAAKRREESERLQRERNEAAAMAAQQLQQQQQKQEQRRSAERRAAAAAATTTTTTTGAGGRRVSGERRSSRPEDTARVELAADNGRMGYQSQAARSQHQQQQQQQQRDVPATTSFTGQDMPSGMDTEPSQARTSRRRGEESQKQIFAPATTGQESTKQPPHPSTRGNAPSSSFPHAFERWEQLSSHWEGLTSFWIRRLEQNKDDLDRSPLNQQMARQVTDLSAAGANLFHAVVELQRLRASSERKFQRWFFETRSDQEKSRAMVANLQDELYAEQQRRAKLSAAMTSIADRSRYDAEIKTAYAAKSMADAHVKEMGRELLIAKEEARRAWEELGRREQEERHRLVALREGQMTMVGGVHVMPLPAVGGAQGRAAGAGDEHGAAGSQYGVAESELGAAVIVHGQGRDAVVQDDEIRPATSGHTPVAEQQPVYDEAGKLQRAESDVDPFIEVGRPLAVANPSPAGPDAGGQPGGEAFHPSTITTTTGPITTITGGKYPVTTITAGQSPGSGTGTASPPIPPRHPQGTYRTTTTTTTTSTRNPQRQTRVSSGESSGNGNGSSNSGDPRARGPTSDPSSRSAGPVGAVAGAEATEGFSFHQGTALHQQPQHDSPETESIPPAGFTDDRSYSYVPSTSEGFSQSGGSDLYDLELQQQQQQQHMEREQHGHAHEAQAEVREEQEEHAVEEEEDEMPWDPAPRHHHPTRLSAVMEEDERSRTVSRASIRSRGMR